MVSTSEIFGQGKDHNGYDDGTRNGNDNTNTKSCDGMSFSSAGQQQDDGNRNDKNLNQNKSTGGFTVGDMISVIDMPPPEESIWWRGKRGFEVGFFPCECVEVISSSNSKVTAAKAAASNKATAAGGGGGRKSNSTAFGAGSSSGNSSLNSNEEEDEDEDEEDEEVTTGGRVPIKPVLRKHGKLISFFRSFVLSRPARGKLKKSGILKERVFGCDLSEHLLNTGQEVPRVLTHCAEFIEKRGIIDGIYRLSGIASNIQKLRVAFDEDRVPNLYDDKAVLQDIHSVSSLLKAYFRELPNPICTYHLYEKFVEAAKSPENERLVLMRDVVQQLPPPNYRTLEYLSRHLYRVSLRGSDTGMTAKNVAIVWAPNLLRSKSLENGGVAALQGVGVQAVVTEYLIRYCELIFSDKMPVYCKSGEDAEAAANSRNNKLRPKSLAISTPTKLLSLEEARSRKAALANAAAVTETQQSFIEVGGGPEKLPEYHTVIQLPQGRKGSMKQKKSPSGWKSIFTKNRASRSSKTEDQPECGPANKKLLSLPNHPLRPVRSAESLVQQQQQQHEKETKSSLNPRPSRSDIPKNPSSSSSRPISMDLDEVAPLELVQRAVRDSNITRNSPAKVAIMASHSRSSSHDSYLSNRKVSLDISEMSEEEESSPDFLRRKKNRENNATKDSSALDLSEIQMNFDLEENEMRIFSEDEAMISNSLGSDLSPMVEDVEELPLVTNSLSNKTKAVDSSDADSNSASPAKNQGRRLSFRQKFKRFTSPTPGRKVDSLSAASEAINKPTSVVDKIVCALSPESHRRKVNHSPQGSPKKSKKNNRVISSPVITAQEEKSSSKIKVEVEANEHVQAAEANPMTISPSIKFIDSASMHESSVTRSLSGASESNAFCAAGGSNPNNNPNRFSMTSSTTTTTTTDDETSGLLGQFGSDQLVVVQVHHDPIIENRDEEEEEDAKEELSDNDDPDPDRVQQQHKTLEEEIRDAQTEEEIVFSSPRLPDDDYTEMPKEDLRLPISKEEEATISTTPVAEQSEQFDQLPKDISIEVYPPTPMDEDKPLLEVDGGGDEPLIIDQQLPNHSVLHKGQSNERQTIQEEIKECPEEVPRSSPDTQDRISPTTTTTAESTPTTEISAPTEDCFEAKTSNSDHSGLQDAYNVQSSPRESDLIRLPVPLSRSRQGSPSEEETSLSSTENPRPVPKPRKSLGLKTRFEMSNSEDDDEVSEPSSLPSSSSVMAAAPEEAVRPERKLKFSLPSPKPLNKYNSESMIRSGLSTTNLHQSSPNSAAAASGTEEDVDGPLQRRNSIHNVPFVDVNDPKTRERIERYKEERRSMLRAKYKVEDYVTAKTIIRPEHEDKANKAPKAKARRSLVENNSNKVPLRKMPVNNTAVNKTKTSVSEIYSPKVGESSRKWSLPKKDRSKSPIGPSSRPQKTTSDNRKTPPRQKSKSPQPPTTSTIQNKRTPTQTGRPSLTNRAKSKSPQPSSSREGSKSPRPSSKEPSPPKLKGPAADVVPPKTSPKSKIRRTSALVVSNKTSNGHEDEVNVKERAAIFGESRTKKKISLNNNRSLAAAGRGKNVSAKDKAVNEGHPNKIKGMAAMFEQKT